MVKIKEEIVEKVKKGSGAEEDKVVISTPNKKDLDGNSDEMILTPLDDYIKTASYLGTKVITPTMREFVYRRRADGLAILNTNLVDKKLKEAIDYVVKFKPEDWIVVCKREAGWRAVKMFSELTGVRVFTKKYPAGILTNIELKDFFETEMIFICDPWLDKNAFEDAKKVHLPIVAVCDTNNHTMHVDKIIIGNNKSGKSLALFFWLLSREYMKAHKIDKKLPTLEDFAGEKLVLEEPRKKRKEKKKEDDLKTEEQKIEERMRMISAGAEEGV
jgi:small subunit ribosomal protein S2